MLGFACGEFLDSIAGLAGKGGITITAFKRSEAGLATVAEEWRGPAFDPTAPATWPVPTETVQARADLLQARAHLEAAN